MRSAAGETARSERGEWRLGDCGTVVGPGTNVVITAAAADRTSFGCSNEADFTYFGDAYFRIALEKPRSFIDAFPAARKEIERREKEEGQDPSKPQRYVGKNIVKALQRLQQSIDEEMGNHAGNPVAQSPQ